MSASEWLVVIVCLALGYWVVSWLMGGKGQSVPAPPGDAAEPRDEGAAADAADASDAANAADWPAVLGVSPAASAETIRAAYRQLMSQYHPDKVASLGPELRELAERKTKQIGSAYAAAARQRGMN